MRRLIFILVLIVVFTGATGVKYVLNGLSDKGFPCDRACSSIAEAKSKGVLICSVQIDPMITGWKGTPVTFESGWIEKHVKTIPTYIWWTRQLPKNDFYLCLRLKSGAEVFGTDVFFLRKDQRHGFASHGTATFDEDLTGDQFQKGETEIYIASDWNYPKENPIYISWNVK